VTNTVLSVVTVQGFPDSLAVTAKVDAAILDLQFYATTSMGIALPESMPQFALLLILTLLPMPLLSGTAARQGKRVAIMQDIMPAAPDT
jgi:hypothetical protein